MHPYTPPMQYGFLIDHDRCIGCHACTVACKSENDVPVGDFRTWVKYTEKGSGPAIKRHFAVLRCNHCSNAPCVKICPVKALEKREDGIVDIDRDACIGCRACMQACPYDAIYLNDDSGAVEKCHFCAHRVENNLEPACAVVCPENAIIAGDLHDETSTISKLIAANDVLVRSPEQNTGPNVFYKGVLAEALEPGSAAKPETFIWTDQQRRKPEKWPVSLPVVDDLKTVLDTESKVEWGWPVALYLVTKGIAAGVMMLAPFLALFGVESVVGGYGLATSESLPVDHSIWFKLGSVLPEIIALLFIGITGFLLVEDLKKPLAFVRLFTRPNWDSWLVKGAWVINAFVAVVMCSLLLRLLGLHAASDVARGVAAIAALGVAGYTAFLFAQCEGRDLWQSKLLLPHLLVQAGMVGGAFYFINSPWFLWPWERFEAGHLQMASVVFGTCSIGHLLLAWEESRAEMHHTNNAKQAAAFLRELTLGSFRIFRTSQLLIGLALFTLFFLPPLTIIPTVIGLYLYEHAYVRAGQLPPLS